MNKAKTKLVAGIELGSSKISTIIAHSQTDPVTAFPPPPPTPITLIFAILAESGLTRAIYVSVGKILL